MTSQPINLPQTPKNAALFSTLPLELRELIYQYIVPLPSSDIFFTPRLCISAADVISRPTSLHSAVNDALFPHWLPPISRVSSATRTDVAVYILRQVEIYVPYHQTIGHLHQFLDTLPDQQGQGAIRKLNFPSFGAARFAKGWETTYVDFAKSCPQLATLQIGINAPDLRKMSAFQGDTLMNAESIIETYKLKDLLALLGLVNVSIELCALLNRKRVSGCVTEVKKVAALLMQMFADRGRQVKVLVIDFRGKEWSEST